MPGEAAILGIIARVSAGFGGVIPTVSTIFAATAARGMTESGAPGAEAKRQPTYNQWTRTFDFEGRGPSEFLRHHGFVVVQLLDTNNPCVRPRRPPPPPPPYLILPPSPPPHSPLFSHHFLHHPPPPPTPQQRR